MNIWAFVLYVLEVLTFGGAVIGMRRGAVSVVKVNNVGSILGLVISVLGFFAIFRLTQQSSADHAVALGVVYAAISAIGLPSFFRSWVRGESRHTSRWYVWVAVSSVVGVVLTSILAFAG